MQSSILFSLIEAPPQSATTVTTRELQADRRVTVSDPGAREGIESIKGEIKGALLSGEGFAHKGFYGRKVRGEDVLLKHRSIFTSGMIWESMKSD